MATIGFDVGIVNMALCVAVDSKVKYCEVFRIGQPKDPIALLIHSLISALNRRLDRIGPIEHVKIEQQCGLKASKNTSLSAALFSYCACTFMDASVEFVSPRSKFKVLAAMQGVPGITERSEEFKNTRGPALKKLAVQAAKALAEHNGDETFLAMLETSKKCDDLSDSALYALLC